jgi:hypothetical protein
LGAGGQNNGAVMSNTIYIEECQNFMIEQLFSQLAKHDHKYAGKTIKLYCDQPDKQTKIEQILVDTYGEILFRICLNKIRICLAQQGSTIIPNRRAEFGMVQRCIPDDDKEVDQKDCGLTYEIYRKLASDWFPDKDKKTTNPPIGWVKKRWILSYLTKEWLEKYSFIEIKIQTDDLKRIIRRYQDEFDKIAGGEYTIIQDKKYYRDNSQWLPSRFKNNPRTWYDN